MIFSSESFEVIKLFVDLAREVDGKKNKNMTLDKLKEYVDFQDSKQDALMEQFKAEGEEIFGQ